ncbi:MAG: hypothetical protein B6245_15670 [Desulfobacteraceae bacterium 4572_88]|nr:MAG: hypothetical protein B6245_15670 [Desulfobacteraceae bacterium 4572_88]
MAGPLSSSQSSVSSGSVFSVPWILFPVSPRLRGRQNILSRRRGGAETGTRSSLILKLPELSAGDCLEGGLIYKLLYYSTEYDR